MCVCVYVKKDIYGLYLHVQKRTFSIHRNCMCIYTYTTLHTYTRVG